MTEFWLSLISMQYKVFSGMILILDQCCLSSVGMLINVLALIVEGKSGNILVEIKIAKQSFWFKIETYKNIVENPKMLRCF